MHPFQWILTLHSKWWSWGEKLLGKRSQPDFPFENVGLWILQQIFWLFSATLFENVWMLQFSPQLNNKNVHGGAYLRPETSLFVFKTNEISQDKCKVIFPQDTCRWLLPGDLTLWNYTNTVGDFFCLCHKLWKLFLDFFISTLKKFQGWSSNGKLHQHCVRCHEEIVLCFGLLVCKTAYK